MTVERPDPDVSILALGAVSACDMYSELLMSERWISGPFRRVGFKCLRITATLMYRKKILFRLKSLISRTNGKIRYIAPTHSTNTPCTEPNTTRTVPS